ncbi:MAG: hypothetical protein JRN23_03765 [Nitrososphaerota archaeon]|nr:hypothetical protein [Nitrososphaerota archaeon]MDG6967688.1 hypothetical protein [Nitrososphaerota archaeon]MDG6978173.1 hypothetical protein [Nitrososphaerota archaeon]MDG7021029.1 hypothetical protein [Nitrososphaerota archaeon]
MVKGRPALLLSAMLALLALQVGTGLSPTVATPLAQAPRTVAVDIYVVNVGNVNQQAGSYEADFYLSFAWNGTWYGPGENQSAAFPANFAILNGQVSELELVSSDANINGTGENYLSYRVYATLYDPMSFARYPLDHQTLSIEVENNDYGNSSLQFVGDGQSQLNAGVAVPGWILDPGSERLTVGNELYKTSFGYPGSPTDSRSYYSEAVFSFSVHRPFAATAMNVLLPLGVLVALAMVTFRVREEGFEIRLEVGVISVFTAVAFLLALNSGIPAQDYLTLADQLMIVGFGMLIYAIALTMVLHSYGGRGVPGWARRLNAASFYAAPLFAVLAVLVLFAA